MKPILSFLLALVFLQAAAQHDSVLVKQCFNTYKEAILNDKGSEALAVLDKKTVKYYDEILEEIKTYDSTKLDKESLINKVTILAIRHRASKDEILKMTGESLFMYAINSGMVGKNSVSNNTVGKIMVNGDFATGVMHANGKATPLSYNFYKENGNWKFNLTSLHTVGNLAFKRMIDESGMPENEALLSMIEMISGKKPDENVWLPVQGQ